jgi:hypothetical protein
MTPRKPPPLQVVSVVALTPREACRAFSPPLNIRDLHTAIRLGRLKAHHVGVRQYVTVDELLAWIKGRKPQTKWRRHRVPKPITATKPLSDTDITGENHE